MGSDHYCLRWNNHQSNLLGVFSQLLRDESLVDVTLACSEGHSIRAHKVVLSACSSYFQTLFIDHPARHPIVILKDVRFAELSTLIEFMYHGEVNVEHCQLSELLRTAESLKVKGLTDMGTTNLAAGGLQTPVATKVQLQAPSQHATSCSYNTSSTSTSSGETTAVCCKTETPDNNPVTMAEPEQTEPTELINKPKAPPPPSLSIQHRDREELNPMVTGTTTCTTTNSKVTSLTSVTPISLVSSERRSVSTDQLMSQEHQFHMPPINQEASQNSNSNTNKDSPTRLTSSPLAGSSIESETLRPDSDIDEDLDLTDEESEDYKPSDMRLLTTVTTEASILHDNVVANAVASIRQSDVGMAAILGQTGANTVGILGNLGRLPSPIVTTAEPIAGPSNIMPPVQQVPLSLKKEVDWGGGSADEKSNTESPSDYPRHSLDPDPTTSEGLIHQAAAVILQQATTSIRDQSSGGPAHLYQCIYCNTAFPHQSKLTRHILSHSLETLKYRELASQHSPLLNLAVVTTQQSDNLSVNSPLNLMDTASNPVQQTPMDIDSLSASASNLSNETPGVVLCKFCGKSFPDVSSLIGHLPVHTGDRPFKCEFCGKAFKLRHHMKDHCRVHTGERPFRCSLCGKTFSRSTILKAHEKTHYPKYVRKFLSPSPLDTEEESPH